MQTWLFFLPSQYFTNQREEFEGTRESILVWLTEMDLQLTNVEHFSESDAEDKMRQLNVSAASSAPQRGTLWKSGPSTRFSLLLRECSRILQATGCISAVALPLLTPGTLGSQGLILRTKLTLGSRLHFIGCHLSGT